MFNSGKFLRWQTFFLLQFSTSNLNFTPNVSIGVVYTGMVCAFSPVSIFKLVRYHTRMGEREKDSKSTTSMLTNSSA